jgi:RNA polymerase sigma-70 factor, ECF subfamily
MGRDGSSTASATPPVVADGALDGDGDVLDPLVDGVRRGDRDAIAAVYLETAPALRAYLRRQVAHGEVADDLVEQTFVALLRSHTTIRGEGRALRTWLYRTARHDLLDWRKRAERRADHRLTEDHLASLPAEDGDPSEVATTTRDPRVAYAVAQLTPEQREVLELRLVADLGVAQVAAVVGRSEGAVKLLQHRALRRLRTLLAPDP